MPRKTKKYKVVKGFEKYTYYGLAPDGGSMIVQYGDADQETLKFLFGFDAQKKYITGPPALSIVDNNDGDPLPKLEKDGTGDDDKKAST